MFGQNKLDRPSSIMDIVNEDGCRATTAPSYAEGKEVTYRDDAAHPFRQSRPSRVSRSSWCRHMALGIVSGLIVLGGLFQPWASPPSARAYPVIADDLRAPVSMAPQAQAPSQDGQNVAGTILAAPIPAPQPSPEPERVVPSSRGGDRPTPDISTPEKFIAAVAEAARDSQLQDKIPSSVTIAQAILESEWGRSQLSKKGQNYFGIKAKSGPGPAGVLNMNTWEVFGGQNVTVNDGFKAYHNLYESVMDHGRFLRDNPRYAAAFKTTDPKEFAKRIHEAGYATDPAYTGKLIGLMDKYNLYKYDVATE